MVGSPACLHLMISLTHLTGTEFLRSPDNWHRPLSTTAFWICQSSIDTHGSSCALGQQVTRLTAIHSSCSNFSERCRLDNRWWTKLSRHSFDNVTIKQWTRVVNLSNPQDGQTRHNTHVGVSGYPSPESNNGIAVRSHGTYHTGLNPNAAWLARTMLLFKTVRLHFAMAAVSASFILFQHDIYTLYTSQTL